MGIFDFLYTIALLFLFQSFGIDFVQIFGDLTAGIGV